MTKKNHYIQLISIAIMSMLFFACNPARRLAKGEYLLNKNHIIDKQTKIDVNDFESYIKQKPNRKIFGTFRFRLGLHNLVNEDRIKRKRIAHDKKNEERNNKRIAKGKKAKKYDRQLFGEWLLDISEPPVIFDSLLMHKSAQQLKLFLNNKGYFISNVKDSVRYKRRKKANVYYTITVSAPYTFNKVTYKVQDDLLKYYVFTDTAKSLIVPGENYDVDVLQKERERITNNLNNNGYFSFTKDYIYYKIDTNLGNRKVNVTLGIKNYAQKYSNYSDSIVETAHQRFYINNIYIEPDFVSKKFDNVAKDTLMVDGYYILHTQKLRFKTKVLLNAVFIRKSELYQLKNVEDTYKRLSELKEFKSINISFTQAHGEYLDCHIQLSPILKQSFSVETEGTNTSGNLGIAGSIVFQNRNLLKGAEVFELKLKGGIEAQRTFNSTTQAYIGNNVNQFNTIEFGPEANLYIPRFLVPFNVKSSKRSNPRTVLTSALIYQRRPDYTRYITNLSFGYTWQETVKKRHTISPLVINFVKVNLQPEFFTYLTESVHDLYILNSFRNHLSTSTRYTFTYNEQDIKKQANFSFFRINAESSGNILRGIYDAVNSIQPNTFIKNDQGSYKLLGIVYSQYVRLDADFRYYFNSNEINKVVVRLAAGVGRPLTNFTSLPFERSFYSGGANGIRAWQARTLGPGSFNSKGLYNYDQFGDGQLEANIEYRFKFFKMLNGAVFIDAGNTWLRQVDTSRAGGDFQLNRVYKEIAIGSGVGLRADFNFFIIRLDVGIKVRDPQFSEPDRWVIQNLFNPEWKRLYRENNNNARYNFLAFNIGIGYPF